MAPNEPIDDAADIMPPVSPLEVLVLLVTGAGTVGGVVWGAVEYGILGAIVGLPAGAALGFFASYVVVLPLMLLCCRGPRELWKYIWGE